ncbi:4a-hydroxytetrahydrobiopterin dehydratase [bacterium]|nr:4a-hydroxytetrahydrobiopterin dehydratase [bacterium]
MSSPALNASDIDAGLATLPGWQRAPNTDGKGEVLHKRYAFKNFREAMGFMLQVSYIAEKHQHHPDAKLGWGYCEIALQTHDAGNSITEKDITVATAIEKLSR